MISSNSNKTIKELRKLLHKKYREKNKQFLVEGWHLVKEAYHNNHLQMIVTTKDFKLANIETLKVSEEVIKTLSNFKSLPEVIGVCNFVDYKSNYTDNYAILDDVQDPGNVGTIIRNALAFGFTNIMLSKGCADIYNPKVIQASQGAIFKVNVIKVNIIEKVLELKENDYIIIASAIENARSLTPMDRESSKKAIILGNEGQGIKKEILNLTDKCYFIDIDNIDSLNVASASAILFYQFK